MFCLRGCRSNLPFAHCASNDRSNEGPKKRGQSSKLLVETVINDTLTHIATPTQIPRSWRKNISAATCTPIASHGADTSPTTARAARKFGQDLATACHMLVMMKSAPKMMKQARLPKMLAVETARKLPTIRKRTGSPTVKLTSVGDRPHCSI